MTEVPAKPAPILRQAQHEGLSASLFQTETIVLRPAQQEGLILSLSKDEARAVSGLDRSNISGQRSGCKQVEAGSV